MSLKNYYNELPTIETKRLILRKINISDTEDWAECTADLEMYKYWGRGPKKRELDPLTIFTETQRKSFGKNELIWGIALKDSNKIIGDIQIFNVENSRIAKVAYRISKKYWNKSYTSEAVNAITDFCFNNTELKRIWSDVVKENIASCKVLEKCGYKQEGLIRQGKMVQIFCDYYIYGKLKDD